MAPFKPVQPAGMTAFKKMDTTPPVVNLLSPAPDSTVSADAEISAKFTETGSGVDLSAVKIMVDGVDLTGQAKVTQSGITLRPVKPLGIARSGVSAWGSGYRCERCLRTAFSR